MNPVIDFHCDLLLYLYGSPERTALDPACRCALPQLQQGGVKLQILPISETVPDSSRVGNKQRDLFYKLMERYPDQLELIVETSQLDNFANRQKIGVMLAIENASAWCEEEDDLAARLADLESTKLVYISLTWNFENRFGGGSLTDVGLKEDGKRLLDFMHGKGIAIDFSHTSDLLAADIFNYLDQKRLNIPVMASHSNSRTVHNVPRNLPDEFIKEIFKRNGIIGLNTIRGFVGEESPEKFADHVDHMVKMGEGNGICLGLDFFYENDLAACFRKSPEQLFFPELANSTCYPKLFSLCRPETIEGISHQNALSFLKEYILVPKK